MTSAASNSFVREVDKSLPKLETCLSVHADSVNTHNVSEFVSTKFLAHDAEIRRAVNIKYSFLAMFLDNAIVREHSMSKNKVSYYANCGMLLFLETI